MMKRTAIATAFTTLLALNGTATAEGSTPEVISPADQCVWNYFNDTAANFKEMPGQYKLNYELSQLDALTTACEHDTGTKSKFFKGIKNFATTVGNVTLTFG